MTDPQTRATGPGVVIFSLLLGLSGCYKGLDAEDLAASGSATEGETAGTDGENLEELPAPTTRFFRLTHIQWENTVQDLFYLPQPTGLTELFRDDPLVSGFIFDNNALSMEVDQALWTGYRIAAGEVALMVSSDEQLLAAIVPPAGGDAAARVDTFIRELGLRAYRRPLTDAEVTEYTGLFNNAPALYTSVSDPFTAGVRHIIETLLQSPHFIYRIESSTDVVDEVIPLSSWELASRLSYLFTNSMPDEDLLAAAEADELGDASAVEAQARRLLADPRAEGVVNHFHHQLLEIDKLEAVQPSPTFFPDVSDQLGEFAIVENELFVREIVFGQMGGWVELLTSTDTFVNAELAEIYGLDGTYGSSFEPATLEGTERSGIFTQVGFLAANATSVNPDPIHRGVFISKRIACNQIAAPPDGVPPLPPPDPNKTNRELVEEHTEDPQTVCYTCHASLINPFGFPYESYDAIGTYRTEDNGFPVDPATTVLIGTEPTAVANARELATALAASDAVHECYLEHWMEFVHSRPAAEEDEGVVLRLGADSQAGALSVQDLLVELVTSPTFLNRATEELP